MAKVAELSKLQVDWQLIVSVGAGSVCTTSSSRQTCFRLAFLIGLVRKCQWAFMPIKLIKINCHKNVKTDLRVGWSYDQPSEGCADQQVSSLKDLQELFFAELPILVQHVDVLIGHQLLDVQLLRAQ